MADSICANPFIFNEGLTEENSFTHLIKSISPDAENEIELIEHSNSTVSYFYLVSFSICFYILYLAYHLFKCLNYFGY